MSLDIRVEQLSESDFSEWDHFVDDSLNGSVFNRSDYLEIFCRANGGTILILGAWRGSRLVGGVALYERKRPYGTIVSYRSLLSYNGIVLPKPNLKYPADESSLRLAILQKLKAELEQRNYQRFLMICRNFPDARPFFSREWSVRPTYTYCVRIDDLKTAWSRITQNARRLISRCQNRGVSVDESGDFDGFFRMHFDASQRKGFDLYLPYDRYLVFVNELREKKLARLYSSRTQEGKVIASQLVLLGAGTDTHTVCAAADPEFFNWGSTPHLRWKVFEDLSALGFQTNDLTDASLHSISRFKVQLGGDLVQNMIIQRRDGAAFRFAQAVYRLIKLTEHSGAVILNNIFHK